MPASFDVRVQISLVNGKYSSKPHTPHRQTIPQTVTDLQVRNLYGVGRLVCDWCRSGFRLTTGELQLADNEPGTIRQLQLTKYADFPITAS